MISERCCAQTRMIVVNSIPAWLAAVVLSGRHGPVSFSQ
jgi:hypothetical protein